MKKYNFCIISSTIILCMFILMSAGCQFRENTEHQPTRIIEQQTTQKEYMLSSLEIVQEGSKNLSAKDAEEFIDKQISTLPESSGDTTVSFFVTHDSKNVAINFDSFSFEYEGLIKEGEQEIPGFSVDSAKNTSDFDGVINLPSGSGKVVFPVYIRTSTSKEPISALATLEITDVDVGAIAELGVFTSEIYFSGLSRQSESILYWLPGKKIKASYTEYWPKLDPRTKRKIKTWIKLGEFKKAMDELVKYLKDEEGIKFAPIKKDDKPVVYKKGSGAGATDDEENVIHLSDGAFTSIAKLYSTLMHELKHTKQNNKPPRRKQRFRELEAWLQECENIKTTGLAEIDKDKKWLRGSVKKWYKELKNKKERDVYRGRYKKCLKRTK